MQAQAQGNASKIEQEYQREIDRLNSKCKDYESIRERLSSEIVNLKNRLRESDEKADEVEARHRREIKRQESIIIELQQSIDEVRAKMLKGAPESQAQLQE